MNDNARKWIAALRSGQFKQAVGMLHRDDGFCCLGVACELHRREHPEFAWIPTTRGDVVFYSYNSQATAYMPSVVREWLGLTSGLGHYGTTDATTLSAVNDSGATFTKIADVIEQYKDTLFLQEPSV